jgi:hypothetical protein
MISSYSCSRRSRRGSAFLVSLIAIMVIASMSTAMLMVGSGRQRERSGSIESTKALYVAEAGMSETILRVADGDLNGVGGPDAPVAFAGGDYWTSVVDNGDDTATVTAVGSFAGETRATQVTMVRSADGVFASALFAGNSSGDPAYDMRFGGTGAQADAIHGNVYSGGNVRITGTPLLDGVLRASGTVSGGTFAPGEEPITGASLPIPDIAGMDYANNNDYDVRAMFSSATYQSNALGGRAWQLPESSPAHIFRKNPNDRTANTSLTAKDDYFLEDPYEPVSSSSVVAPANGTMISLSGQNGNVGANGSDKVYYIDGNLWIHNNNIYSFTLANNGANPIRATFVVKGNVYFSDNILYQQVANRDDAIAFIAIRDSAVADSGNIYFGDPSFGTLEQMDAFMYAENNFYDNNLSSSGSARVTVNGNMTAGNQVRINRDFGSQHSKLTVNFDPRIMNQTVTLPGLPGQAGGEPTWTVASWTEIAPQP